MLWCLLVFFVSKDNYGLVINNCSFGGHDREVTKILKNWGDMTVFLLCCLTTGMKLVLCF